jgi:hypothetical protein
MFEVAFIGVINKILAEDIVAYEINDKEVSIIFNAYTDNMAQIMGLDVPEPCDSKTLVISMYNAKGQIHTKIEFNAPFKYPVPNMTSVNSGHRGNQLLIAQTFKFNEMKMEHVEI